MSLTLSPIALFGNIINHLNKVVNVRLTKPETVSLNSEQSFVIADWTAGMRSAKSKQERKCPEPGSDSSIVAKLVLLFDFRHYRQTAN